MMNTIDKSIRNVAIVFGAMLVLCGIVLALIGANKESGTTSTVGGMCLMLVGAALAVGQRPVIIAVNKFFRIEFQGHLDGPDNRAVPVKSLPPDIEDRRREAEALPLPGRDAQAFNLMEEGSFLRYLPSSDAMMPMYLLDKNYRILDWNEAFSVAFDRSMEGRRGKSVIEWVFLLDNYVQVRDHGIEAFKNPDDLPKVDVEPIEFTSEAYGKIRAIKRSFQIPDVDGHGVVWLTLMDLQFDMPSRANAYQVDLVSALRKSLIWTEYALSYDLVLTNATVYRQLISTLIGGPGRDPAVPPLPPIPAGAKVLDLGAGTGNITELLADPSDGRVICAVENNRTMLNILRQKCNRFAPVEAGKPGVSVVKQDVVSLFGLPRHFFTHAIMNNFLYMLDDATALKCLKQVRTRLKPGGELRISGPRKRTNLDVLFKRMKQDLIASGNFERLEQHYNRVKRINEQLLEPYLYQRDISDVEALLERAGFSSLTYQTERAYAGQSMIVCATALSDELAARDPVTPDTRQDLSLTRVA